MMFSTIKRNFFIAFAVLFASFPALALGGLDKGQETAGDIKTGAYAILGICAALYLIWIALMCFLDKKQWSDLGIGVFHVALAGATVALATWAWGLFSG